jgi:predicted transglutaminase-like cysteine proteinase
MVVWAARLVLLGLLSQICFGCSSLPAPVAAIPRAPVPYTLRGETIPLATPLPGSGTLAIIPSGFIGFCLRTPDQCPPVDQPERLAVLDATTWRLLEQVNRTVNDEIKPLDDLHHYGDTDYWTLPADGLGDCEDYALLKRKRLMEAGLPVSALRMAIVDVPREGRHAVLTVVTDRGDYVLDNLHSDVFAWSDRHYVWIERQDPSRSLGWTSLTPPRRMAAR